MADDSKSFSDLLTIGLCKCGVMGEADRVLLCNSSKWKKDLTVDPCLCSHGHVNVMLQCDTSSKPPAINSDSSFRVKFSLAEFVMVLNRKCLVCPLPLIDLETADSVIQTWKVVISIYI